MTMITRVSFCSKCYEKNQPKTGQMFIAFGHRQQILVGKVVRRNGVRGFVPTIYEFQRLTNDTVYFVKLCCMEDCGSYVVEMGKKEVIYINEDRWQDGYMSLANWNALVMFKDTGFKI